MPAGITLTHPVNTGHTVFAYVLQGNGYFEPERDPYGYELIGNNYFDFKRECIVKPGTLVIYEQGDHVEISAGMENLRFLLISGKPIREPIAWYGPIVMNTQEELRTAFEEFQNGSFLKHNTE